MSIVVLVEIGSSVAVAGAVEVRFVFFALDIWFSFSEGLIPQILRFAAKISGESPNLGTRTRMDDLYESIFRGFPFLNQANGDQEHAALKPLI
jgi:hypothetical protein